MWTDIFNKFRTVYWAGYAQQIIIFPLEVFCRFLPASGLTIYYLVKKKIEKIKFNLSNTNTNRNNTI